LLIRTAIAGFALGLFGLVAEAHEAVTHHSPHPAESHKAHASTSRKPHAVSSHPKPPKTAKHAVAMHAKPPKVPKH
jgi:hypothetical protein